MREILFKGKRQDNNEWIEGCLIRVYKRICRAVYQPHEYAIQSAEEWIAPPFVIAETVGQYTGLTDKNGKKIFEGDIVRYRPEDWCEPIQSVVEYCADKWNYPAFDLKDHDYEANGLQCAHEEGIGLEVIGNIHDNPELLKEDEK